MVCLDTDILIALIRERRDAISFLASLDESEPLSTTFVSSCELLEGACLSSDVGKELDRVKKVSAALKILLPTAATAEKFGSLSAELKKNGAPIGNFDVLIACIALEYGETLVSRNVKHFERIKGLKVMSW
jgi:predicted nucleic acid-binding protein